MLKKSSVEGISGEESCGLLINVIRTLTTSASTDQKQIEKTRLEAGYQRSAKQVDELLSRHQKDVSNSLKTFRAVSGEITSCRQRIHAVKNALAQSKVLLQCRRDDLKKLWIENVEQKCICNILSQIEEIKQMDVSFDQFLQNSKYRDAVNVLKKADIILHGPLSEVSGLDQLRNHVVDLRGSLFERVVTDLLELLSAQPFESQMLELMKGIPSETAHESPLCIQLNEKYKEKEPSLSATLLLNTQALSIGSRVGECLESLAVFDQMITALDQVFSRSKAIYSKAIGDTVCLLRLVMKESVADSTHLAQLISIVTVQIHKAHEAHQMLSSELSKVGRYDQDVNVEVRFWDSVQEVLQTLVMKHLDIYTADPEDTTQVKSRSLFRFDGTSCVSSYSSRLTAQPIASICKPDPYNIIPIFRMLNAIAADIELKGHTEKFNTFLHQFVMSTFIKRVRDDIEAKSQMTLSRVDVWSALSQTTAHDVRLLTSALAIFETCTQVANLVNHMEQYTQQFALIWLDIIRTYTASAAETYSLITKSRSTEDGEVGERTKISATWVADEDISRTLKSLPQWALLSQAGVPPLSCDVDTTPTGRMAAIVNESDHDVRRRTEKEAELLISNFGRTKSIDKSSLIMDTENLRSLICMHESLQWFVMKMRELMFHLPQHAQNILGVAMVEGNERLKNALSREMGKLENMSETCLLMIHLELRVHCFYHLLPLAQFKAALPHDDIDKNVHDFGQDMRQFHDLLKSYLLPTKIKYLFDGLGHLCGSIFIHSSQYMAKLSDSNKKRMIRNIGGVQKHLCKLTGRRESELDRAKMFFELLNKDPDQLLAMIMERGATFSFLEYTHLISLAVRSDHTLSTQPGALDTKINQLRSILDQKNIKAPKT